MAIITKIEIEKENLSLTYRIDIYLGSKYITLQVTEELLMYHPDNVKLKIVDTVINLLIKDQLAKEVDYDFKAATAGTKLIIKQPTLTEIDEVIQSSFKDLLAQQLYLPGLPKEETVESLKAEADILFAQASKQYTKYSQTKSKGEYTKYLNLIKEAKAQKKAYFKKIYAPEDAAKLIAVEDGNFSPPSKKSYEDWYQKHHPQLYPKALPAYSDHNPAPLPAHVTLGSSAIVNEIAKYVPNLKEALVKCPRSTVCIFSDQDGKWPLDQLIIHLNDQGCYDYKGNHIPKWAREQIADWLETLDLDLAFKVPS